MDNFPEVFRTEFHLQIRDIQFALVCYEVLSFFFLTLFWFYCLGCFMGWLTVYKILKFGLVYYVILSFDYGSTH
jgi:hypothetical protein